ncbi:MAG: hypothetical protein IPJ88_02305 [Myxococcales bacterium]|nr:MAG: hypothetical protein IPJ88_02305 [Myxococcales bacterium]
MIRFAFIVCSLLSFLQVAQGQDNKGWVYDPNPDKAFSAISEVTLDGLDTNALILSGNSIEVSTCVLANDSCTAVHYAIADAQGDFFYEPDEASESDAFAEVNAFFHLQRAADYFNDQHQSRWSCNCGSPVLNAFINPDVEEKAVSSLAFYQYNDCSSFSCGYVVLSKTVDQQGLVRSTAYDGDLLYHEYVHAIVDERNQNPGYSEDELGASYEAGAVSEAIADYFAAVISNDPQIGEHFAGIGSVPEKGALRDISQRLSCPEDLSGQRHRDGRILASALWSLRSESADVAAMDQWVFESAINLSATPSFSSFVATMFDGLEDPQKQQPLASKRVQAPNRYLPNVA